jgi:hypothetical protein
MNTVIRPTMRAQKLAFETIANTKRKTPLSKKQLLVLSGYSKSTIEKTPFKPFSTQGFQLALQQAGATEEKLAKVVSEAMDAKTQTWFKGESIESNHVDHAIRLRAVDQLAELTGAKITKVQVQSVNLNLDASEIAALLSV